MASSATQKVLHVGVKKQPGTLVYVRRVSGDLNEVCSSTKGVPSAVSKIITQVTFRREPGYFYYVDAAGDISRAKRVARGASRKRAPAKPVTSTKRAVSAQGGTDYIALVLDKSASMRGITAAALKARWRWVLTAKKRDGSRYATSREEALRWFGRFFAYAAESDFLTGRDGKWTSCDLAWLCNEANFAKVLQGNYVREAA